MELTANERTIVQQAMDILEEHTKKVEIVFTCPQHARDFLALKIGHLEHEVFCVMFLDSKHRLIEFEEMFRGTITQTSVYPREVIKKALKLNAAAVVFSHNHPSGNIRPSQQDEYLTQHLKTALAFVDVSLLDHIIVGGGKTFSMAEKGMI